MSGILKKVGIGILAIVSVMLVTALSFLVWVLNAKPDYDRVLTANSLSAPVKIYRDAYGIPHIFAETHSDAMFALGYVQGQDRGWQMEFLRRAVEGRMSEIAGDMLVELDREFIVSGAAKLADLSYAAYSEETHRAIEAFAAGVNASIESGQYSASPEFRAFGVTPEPWTERQVGALTYLIGSVFDTSSRRVLWAKGLRTDLGDARAAQLVRDFEEVWPTLYRDIGGLQETADQTRAALTTAGLPTTPQVSPTDVGQFEDVGKGTNFFLLGPDKTTTGAAILAVDPHLDIDAPGLYYPAAITLPDQILRGAFWVSSPAIHFGHNRDIAWGMTGAVVDNSHYVLEKIDPSNPNAYMRLGGSYPFDVETREISIKGKEDGEALELRYTDHGLVVSDFDEDLQALAASYGPGLVIVRKSAPLLYGQFYLESGVLVQQARDWQGFRAAFARHGGANTVAYADRSGAIGVQSAGHVPVRAAPEAWAEIPRGWLGEGNWLDLAPYDALPSSLNPPRGWANDSNSRLVPADYPLFLTARALAPYRVARSETVLNAADALSFEDVIEFQLDNKSVRPSVLFGAVSQHLAGLEDPLEHEAAERLMAWDGTMDASAPEPLIYTSFEHALHQRLVGTHVTDTSYANGRGDPITIARLLTSENSAEWCDKPGTQDLETCGAAVREAFSTAMVRLQSEYGKTLDDWSWGSAHKARFSNRYFLDFIPVVSDWAARTVVTGSGPGTLNVGGWSSDAIGDYPQTSGAVWRQVIDLSDLDKSLFQIAPGVSGNPASPYYDSTLADWQTGEYFSLSASEKQLQDDRALLTTLTPKNPDGL